MISPRALNKNIDTIESRADGTWARDIYTESRERLDLT